MRTKGHRAAIVFKVGDTQGPEPCREEEPEQERLAKIRKRVSIRRWGPAGSDAQGELSDHLHTRATNQQSEEDGEKVTAR